MIDAIGPVAGAIVAQPGRSPGCTATGGVVIGWGTRPTSPGQAGQSAQASEPQAALLGNGRGVGFVSSLRGEDVLLTILSVRGSGGG